MISKIYRFVLVVVIFLIFIYFFPFQKIHNLTEFYINFVPLSLFYGLPILGLLKKKLWAVIYIWVVIIFFLMPATFLSIYFITAAGVFDIREVFNARDHFVLIFMSLVPLLSFLNFMAGLEIKQ